MRHTSASLGLLAISFFALSACSGRSAVDSPPPRHGGEIVVDVPSDRAAESDPRRVELVDRIDFGAAREGTFGASDVAYGYVVAARRGALFTVLLDTGAAAEVRVIGPLGDAPLESSAVLAAGPAGAELTATAPSDGSYLIVAFDASGSGGPYSVTLSCASAECRVECGPDGACPSGGGASSVQCAFVQCIRAPCPSFCHAGPPIPDASPEPVAPQPYMPRARRPGDVGSTCGTRGATPCADGLFCRYEESAQCGETDRPGTCQARPDLCTRDYTPVCGCDGRTYGNRCSAWAAGVSVRRAGEC